MSQWIEAITSHPVHGAFSEVEALLKSFAVPEGHSAGEEAISRAQLILSHVARLVQTSDPFLLTPAWLNQLHKQLNGIRNELQAFVSDGNEGHFQAVQNHADALLEGAARLPSAGSSEAATHLVEAVSEARQNAERLVEGVRQRSQQTDERLAQAQSAAEQLRNELEATRSEVTSQKSRLDTAISEFQGQFSVGEDRRRQEFETSNKQFLERSTQAIGEERQRVEALLQKLNEDSSGSIAELEKRKREALDLVHVIGNVGVTGNFKEVADANKKAADRLRILALVFMTFIIFGVAATIQMAARPEAEWHQIAIRVGITLALAVPAGYAARESAGHRRVERDTRSFELQLASLDPYLEKLPEAERYEVKKKLSERFFGSPTHSSPPDETPISKQTDVLGVTIKELGDLLKRAIDVLAKR